MSQMDTEMLSGSNARAVQGAGEQQPTVPYPALQSLISIPSDPYATWILLYNPASSNKTAPTGDSQGEQR